VILEKDYIYHIYNQGNNKQKIFFNRDNYLFFLRKIKIHILPYADVLAWCLMPSHFHFMVLVKESQRLTQSEALTKGVSNSQSLNSSQTLTDMTLNESLGIMLRSYTRAINKQEKRTGSLFKEHTKAECINCPNGITPSFYNTNSGTQIQISTPEKQYPQICFNYIHQNPVKAKMVKKSNDWEFSSAMDYADLRDGKIINKEVTKEYIIF